MGSERMGGMMLKKMDEIFDLVIDLDDVTSIKV